MRSRSGRPSSLACPCTCSDRRGSIHRGVLRTMPGEDDDVLRRYVLRGAEALKDAGDSTRLIRTEQHFRRPPLRALRFGLHLALVKLDDLAVNRLGVTTVDRQ